jgi:hypothetical protein
MSQFAFMQREWPAVFEAAARAEAAVHADPHVACFCSRRALELAAERGFFRAFLEWRSTFARTIPCGPILK